MGLPGKGYNQNTILSKTQYSLIEFIFEYTPSIAVRNQSVRDRYVETHT